MSDLKFKKIIFSVFGILVILIGSLVFLNTSVKAFVKDVTLKGSKDKADINKQVLNIEFSHTIDKKLLENKISINPPSPYSLNWTSNKNLEIRFKQSLQTNTKYSLSIKNDGNLREDINYEFTTKDLRLVYIEKEVESVQTRIVSVDKNFENKKTLFEKENIKQFSKNSNYLIALTLEENKTNSIYIVNLKNNEIKKLDLPLSLIGNVSISPIKNEFLYTKSEAKQRGSDIIPGQEFNLYIFNLDNNVLELINPQNTAVYVREAKYSPDGSAILYKNDGDLYYLVDTSNFNNIIALGTHDSSGGFNSENNKIVFNDIPQNVPEIFVYYTSKTSRKVSPTNIYPIDPIFMNNSDDIIYSQKVEGENPAIFTYEIKSIDQNGVIKSILKDENKTLELSQVSPDDRYLVIETFKKSRSINSKDFRVIGFQVKPGTADLIVYDLVEEKVIDKGVRGIGGIWELE